MTFLELNNEYNKMQEKYGDKDLDSITFGGKLRKAKYFFVFMNPTAKNIASKKSWHGLKAPWIGTKNIWDMFYSLNLIDKDIYDKIKEMRQDEWTEDFADKLYNNLEQNDVYITNLAKCTMSDARPIPNSIYLEYLSLFIEEIKNVEPENIILFGNQVSSIVLNEKISVSKSRKKEYIRKIDDKDYSFYTVYYPVGNGRFNMDKSIEDIKWIMR